MKTPRPSDVRAVHKADRRKGRTTGRTLGTIEARTAIVGAANVRAAKNGYRDKPYRMPHLQQCAHIARKFHLVHPDVLKAAGFNPDRRS